MKDVIAKLIDAARTVAPLLNPGAGAAIKVAEGIVKTLEAAKDLTTDEGDQAVLDKTITDLQKTVNAHADSTIDKLKG